MKPADISPGLYLDDEINLKLKPEEERGPWSPEYRELFETMITFIADKPEILDPDVL